MFPSLSRFDVFSLSCIAGFVEERVSKVGRRHRVRPTLPCVVSVVNSLFCRYMYFAAGISTLHIYCGLFIRNVSLKYHLNIYYLVERVVFLAGGDEQDFMFTT